MKNIIKKKLRVPFTANIKFFLNENLLFIKGEKGSSCLEIFNFKKKLNFFKVLQFRATFLRLIGHHIVGVSSMFIRRLIFFGVGFRIESIENNVLKLKLGFSHFVFLKIPFYIKVFSPKKTFLIVESINDQLLNEFCFKLQALKFPDSYKGKGILFVRQKVILKKGKKK